MPESQYPNATFALEYRPEVAALMAEVKRKSETVRTRFMAYLDGNPKAPIEDLTAYLSDIAQEASRFSNPAFQSGYEKIQKLGAQAVAEFDAAFEMLGESMDIDHTVQKLTAKYGQPSSRPMPAEKLSPIQRDAILQRLRNKVGIHRDADLMGFAGIARVNGREGYEYLLPDSPTRYSSLADALLAYAHTAHPDVFGEGQPVKDKPLRAERERPLKRPQIHMLTALLNFADFTGRATRAEYWLFILLMVIINFGGGFLFGISGSTDALTGFQLVSGMIFLIPNLAVAVRRIHDLGRSGWWVLLMFVPLVNLGMIIWFMFDGEKGPNEYGPDPKAYYRARQAAAFGA